MNDEDYLLMYENFKSNVWELSRYMSAHNLTRLSDEELCIVFQKTFELRMHITARIKAEPTELQIIANVLVRVITELYRRNLPLRIPAFEIAFDKNGEFAKGKEELRFIFSLMTFEQMMELVDSLLVPSLNDAQRKAILDLAYEKVYAGQSAN